MSAPAFDCYPRATYCYINVKRGVHLQVKLDPMSHGLIAENVTQMKSNCKRRKQERNFELSMFSESGCDGKIFEEVPWD